MIMRWHGLQVRCIQATLGDLISGSASSIGAEDAAEPENAVHTAVEVATVDSFQVLERSSRILSAQTASLYCCQAGCRVATTQWLLPCLGTGHEDVSFKGVSTLSMLQGMEKAVIVLSTAVTRAGAFASDARRLNVALTRAKRHLIIVGGCLTHISVVSISTPTTEIDLLIIIRIVP